MPAKTARIQSKQRCDDSGPDAVVDSGVEVEVDSVATEGPGGTDLAAAVPHATGIEISTEAGHVAGGIATVTVMTAEGPGSAHSPVEALAAVVVETETVEASAVVVVETETVEASAVVVVETETVEALVVAVVETETVEALVVAVVETETAIEEMAAGAGTASRTN
jgi:hypothetical protein